MDYNSQCEALMKGCRRRVTGKKLTQKPALSIVPNFFCPMLFPFSSFFNYDQNNKSYFVLSLFHSFNTDEFYVYSTNPFVHVNQPFIYYIFKSGSTTPLSFPIS